MDAGVHGNILLFGGAGFRDSHPAFLRDNRQEHSPSDGNSQRMHPPWQPDYDPAMSRLIVSLDGGMIAALERTCPYLAFIDGPERVPVIVQSAPFSQGKENAFASGTFQRGEFESCYTQIVAELYPPRADGRTLFPFRRLFIIARKA